MILRLSFEEVTTLNAAAERVLRPPSAGSVLAPPEVLAELGCLHPGVDPHAGEISSEPLLHLSPNRCGQRPALPAGCLDARG